MEFCTGRLAEIDAALDGLTAGGLSTIAVLGETGLGKSQAMRAVGAAATARGMTVIQLQTGDDHQKPFATVLSGFPTLKPLLAGGPIKTTWPQAVDAITALRTGAGLVIIIDDAHRMDRQSARFLRFLHARSADREHPGPAAVALTIPEVNHLPPKLTRRLMKLQQTRYLQLEPLNQTDLAELVGKVFPQTSGQLRRLLTIELMRRSDGHPAVIDALIPLFNDSTGTLDLGPTPSLEMVRSVIDDANRSAGDGAYRDAVEKLSSLHKIPGLALNQATRTLLAVSLYRIGAFPAAAQVAGELVEEALAADDHRAALAAATLGLPEAEQHDGSPERTSWLLRIDPERLDRPQQSRHAAITARQLALNGRSTDGGTWWRKAQRLAVTADDLATAASAGWYITYHETAPAEQIAALEPVLDEPGLSPERRSTILEHLIISRYEAGQIDRAVAAADELGQAAEATGDLFRTWHHLSFQSTLAFEQGQWDQAEQHRIGAVLHAQTHAIGEGETLYLAQKFNEALLTNQHAEFAAMMPKLPPEIAESWFGRVAMVEALRATGHLDQVEEDGRDIINRCLTEPGYRVPITVAFLSRFIDEVIDGQTRSDIVDLLRQRAGSLLMHGLGAASLGPTDRYLFHITGDLEHLQRAIEVADDAGLPLWRVLLRVEYAASTETGSPLLLRHAKAIAEGTDLTRLLTAR